MADRSAGVYRIPYESGTTVKVTRDHLTHTPLTRIDMVATDGREPYRIVSAAAGVVRFIVDGFSENRPGESPCNNNYVWIEHPNGEWTKYSHMTKESVTGDAGLSVGDRVNTGTFLGFEGDVGCASGTHLHFEVGVPSDPSDPIDEDGFLRGGAAENRIPRVCGAPNETLVDDTTWLPIRVCSTRFGRRSTVVGLSGSTTCRRLPSVASSSASRIFHERERADMALVNSKGKLTFLRVHEVGGKFGPPSDQIDVEAVLKLDTQPSRAMGFQVRNDNNRPVRQAMLDLLRDAFSNNLAVSVDYDLPTGKSNGVVERIALER